MTACVDDCYENKVERAIEGEKREKKQFFV